MNMPRHFNQRAALSAMLLCLSLPVVADDIQDAHRLFKQGQQTQALDKLNTILAKSPRDMQARYLKAVIYTQQGRTNDAIHLFQSIIGDYPNIAEPYNNLGVIHASQGQYEKAKNEFETAIRLKPNYAIAHENLGDLHVKVASKSYGYATDADRRNASAKDKREQTAALAGGKPVVVTAKAAEPAAPLAKPTPVVAAPAPATTKPVVVASAQPTAPAPAVAKPETPAPLATTTPSKAATAPAPIKPATPVAPAPAAAKPAVVAAPTAPAAKAAAPAPAAKPAPVATANGDAAVMNAVNGWASAWSDKDAKKYLSFYAKDFATPGGVSRSAWESTRQQRISKPQFIKVGIDNAKVTLTDSTHATVTFKQNYKSSTLNEVGSKTLVMVKSGDAWLIKEEKAGHTETVAAPKAEATPAKPAAPAASVKPSTPVVKPAKAVAAEPPAAPAIRPSMPVLPKGVKSSGIATGAAGDGSPLQAVHGWANAWSAKNADKYLSFYASDFSVPGGASRAAWESAREDRISKPKFIRVSVDNAKVAQTDNTHATVTFKQTYRSSSVTEVSNKTLVMVKTADGWQIKEEQSK